MNIKKNKYFNTYVSNRIPLITRVMLGSSSLSFERSRQTNETLVI